MLLSHPVTLSNVTDQSPLPAFDAGGKLAFELHRADYELMASIAAETGDTMEAVLSHMIWMGCLAFRVGCGELPVSVLTPNG